MRRAHRAGDGRVVGVDPPDTLGAGVNLFGTTDLRDHVASSIELAIKQAASDLDVRWDLSFGFRAVGIHPAQGIASQFECWLTLACASPILNASSIQSTAPVDPLGIARPETALAVVRQLAENIREARAADLGRVANGNGSN